MGVLDKLMFWKDEPVNPEVDPDFEVNGCFTLPTDDSVTESAAQGAVEDLTSE